MKRMFDIFLALLLFLLFIPYIFLIVLAIKVTMRGSIIYWSRRIGKNNREFLMPKFRTMKITAPEVAAHLLINPNSHITSLGSFLRKTSSDELPQLFSILKGDMSFVGPRPALFNQYDLIELRTLKGLHYLTPGLTGWAQVNGRDDLSIAKKVYFDAEYLKKKSLMLDIKILYLTFIKIIQMDGVQH